MNPLRLAKRLPVLVWVFLGSACLLFAYYGVFFFAGWASELIVIDQSASSDLVLRSRWLENLVFLAMLVALPALFFLFVAVLLVHGVLTRDRFYRRPQLVGMAVSGLLCIGITLAYYTVAPLATELRISNETRTLAVNRVHLFRPIESRVVEFEDIVFIERSIYETDEYISATVCVDLKDGSSMKLANVAPRFTEKLVLNLARDTGKPVVDKRTRGGSC